MEMKKQDIAVYKGDDLLCFGSVVECANWLGINKSTMYFYMSSSYKNRIIERNWKNPIEVIKIEDDEE
jgi:hypothetical protein